MFDRKGLEDTKRKNADAQAGDKDMQHKAMEFLVASDRYDYAYQWTWLGLPIIQMPPDMIACQEIIWNTKPDVIIETGIAWGGSLVYYASLLELIGKGKVVGIDRVLPEDNRAKLAQYRFSERIVALEGSSTDSVVFEQASSHIKPGATVMIILDSNHAHQHVLDELRLYAPLVTKGQYMVVTDTIIEDFPEQPHRPRPWGKGDNPKTAIRQYLTESDRFELDTYIENKLLTTFYPEGYYHCIKD